MAYYTILRTAFHLEEEKQKNEFKNDVFVKSFLMGTLLRPKQGALSLSLVSLLQGSPELLRIIFDYARPSPPDEEQFYYKCGMHICLGVEHVHMEALEEVPSLTNMGIGVGVLMNQPIGSARFAGLMIPFLKKFAWKKNNDDDDDSWWNKGQLRQAWKEFWVPRFCDQPNGRCRGACCALKGDAIDKRQFFTVKSPNNRGRNTENNTLERNFPTLMFHQKNRC